MNLGRLKAVYYERQFNWSDVVTLFLPGIVAITLPFGYGLFLIEKYYTNFGPAAVLPNTYIWFVLALLSFAIFSTLLVYRHSVSRNYLAIFENGLIYSHFGKKIIPWKEISGIKVTTTTHHFLGMLHHTNYCCTLQTQTNRSFHLDPSLQSLGRIIFHIKSNVYPRLSKEFHDQFQLTGRVKFGPMATYREGISLDGRHIPWRDINTITIQRGKLVLELAESRRLKILIGEIPNAELLLEIIQSTIADQ